MQRPARPLIATLLLSTLALASVLSQSAVAQTTFRCDVGGQTVYRDTPCPPGAAAKAVTPSQDSPEQRAASQAANAQMRKDNADLNKRLTERQKLEAAERAAARKAAKPAKATAQKGKGKAAGKAKTGKSKPAKKAAKPKKKATASINAVVTTS
jgi:Domain of unknown function (DUF4124)